MPMPASLGSPLHASNLGHQRVREVVDQAANCVGSSSTSCGTRARRCCLQAGTPSTSSVNDWATRGSTWRWKYTPTSCPPRRRTRPRPSADCCTLAV